MFKNLSVIVAILATLTSIAQSDREDYLNKITELCPGADIIEFEAKEDYVEVEYICDGQLFEVGLDLRKQVIFTESNVEIPEEIETKIQQKLDKKYAGWSQDEFSLIQLSDTAFYKFEMLKDGLEENMYFTLDGKYFRPYTSSAEDTDLKGKLSSSQYYQSAKYDFLNPDLPEVLVEVSGIAVVDENTLFCIQDEIGAVFEYNIGSATVVNMIRFTDEGDFEDVAVSGNRVYVLRSDGTVFHFNYKNRDGKIEQVILPLNCLNAEGLYFDNRSKFWYAACKEPSINQPGTFRSVYKLAKDTLSQPIETISIDLEEVNQLMRNNYPELDGRVELNPSAKPFIRKPVNSIFYQHRVDCWSCLMEKT